MLCPSSSMYWSPKYLLKKWKYYISTECNTELNTMEKYHFIFAPRKIICCNWNVFNECFQAYNQINYFVYIGRCIHFITRCVLLLCYSLSNIWLRQNSLETVRVTDTHRATPHKQHVLNLLRLISVYERSYFIESHSYWHSLAMIMLKIHTQSKLTHTHKQFFALMFHGKYLV